MDLPSYLELQKIGERSELVLPIFGIHPRRAADYADRLPDLSRYIDMSPAIGEIGLDLHWVKDTRPIRAKESLGILHRRRRRAEQVRQPAHQSRRKRNPRLVGKDDVRRAIIHWYSGPMDVLEAMIDFGCYFTIGVEVLYSDYIKEIAKAVPDHLLITETDNPGALKWLKKNDEVGMPAAIKTSSER